MNTTLVITNRLKVLRAEKDITQAELVELVGVIRSTINYLEKNEYTPSLSLAMRLARYFALPIEQIFILEDE
jgi:putative transcriptional regulator